MARIVVIGGHGKVALHLARVLTERGDEVILSSAIPDHADDVAATGAEPVTADVEQLDTAALAAAGRRPRRRGLLRRGRRRQPGAHLRRRPRRRDPGRWTRPRRPASSRFVMVSYFGAGPDHGVSPENSFFPYAEAKAAADAHLRASGLDWTFWARVDSPWSPRRDGSRSVKGKGSVSRADVARHSGRAGRRLDDRPNHRIQQRRCSHRRSASTLTAQHSRGVPLATQLVC